MKWSCRLPFKASGRVRGHLEDTRSRLSPSRGGQEEKPELRRRGDSWRVKPPNDVHKARALGVAGGVEESLSCDGEMPRGDGVGRKRRRSRSCDDAVAA